MTRLLFNACNILLCTIFIFIHIFNDIPVVLCHVVDTSIESAESLDSENRVLTGTSNSAQSSSSAWTIGTTKLLILRIRPSGLNPLGVPIEEPYQKEQLLKALDNTSEFFIENSAGKQTLEFSVLNEVLESNFLAEKCEGTSRESRSSEEASAEAFNQIAEFAESEATQLGYNLDNYDRILIQFSSCPQLFTSGGRGNVRGKRIWIQGAVKKSPDDTSSDNIMNLANSLTRLICHEIGHTNGALHDEYLDKEYGNPLSVMGSGMGHFPAPYKVAFHWLDTETQVQHVTLATETTVQVRLYGIEQGAYKSETRYAVKIDTADSGETIWGEVRVPTVDSPPGLMVTWFYDRLAAMDNTAVSILRTFMPHLLDEQSSFGPTQLLARNGVEYAQKLQEVGNPLASSAVLVHDGQRHFYDLNNTGLVISVIKSGEDTILGKFLDVVIQYIDKDSLEENFGLSDLVTKRMKLDCESREENLPNVIGSTRSENLQLAVSHVHDRFEYTIVQLTAETQSLLSTNSACPVWQHENLPETTSQESLHRRIKAAKTSGVYFFKSFPLHFVSQLSSINKVDFDLETILIGSTTEQEEWNDTFHHLSVGASHYFDFLSCDGWRVPQQEVCHTIRIVSGGSVLQGKTLKLFWDRLYITDDGIRIRRLLNGASSLPHVAHISLGLDNYFLNGEHIVPSDIPIWTVQMPDVDTNNEHNTILVLKNDSWYNSTNLVQGIRLPLNTEVIVLEQDKEPTYVTLECFSPPVTMGMQNTYSTQVPQASYDDFVETGYAVFVVDKKNAAPESTTQLVSSFTWDASCDRTFTCFSGYGIVQSGETFATSSEQEFTCASCSFGSGSPGDRPCTANLHREILFLVSVTLLILIPSLFCMWCLYSFVLKKCRSNGTTKIDPRNAVVEKPTQCDQEK